MNRRNLILGLLSAPVAILIRPRGVSVPISIGSTLDHRADTKECRHEFTAQPCEYELDPYTHEIVHTS